MSSENKVVYVHYRTDDEKPFYIGMGNSTRPFDWSGRNKFWNRVKKKHGIIVEIVAENLSVEAAWDLEKALIRELREQHDTLTNLTDGGEGAAGLFGASNPNFRKYTVMFTDEFVLCFTSAAKMDEYGFSTKAVYNTNTITSNRFYDAAGIKYRFDVVRTDDISEVETIMDTRQLATVKEIKDIKNIGNNHHSFGKTLTDEHKEKLKIASTGKVHTQAAKNKIRKANTGKKNHSFKGFSVGFKDNLYVIACGSKELTNLGFNQGLVSQCLVGNKPHHKGFTWVRMVELNKQMFKGLTPFDPNSMCHLFGFDFCISRMFVK